MRKEDLAALGVECVELGQGVSFVMESPALLSMTGYKVLRSQDRGRFVPCVRSRINGREKITYLTEGSQTLASSLEAAQGRSGQRLLRSFVEAVQLVGENGFLALQSVLVAPDHVYVDAATSECRLVCLPLTRFSAGGDLETRQDVYDLCAAACTRLFGASSPLAGIERTAEYRSGELGALRDVLARGAHEAVPEQAAFSRPAQRPAQDPRPAPGARWYLRSARAGVPDLVICGASTVVGKSSTKSDQVIPGNPAISRAHCRLCVLSDGTLTVEDLGSANGTFVNGTRIAPGRAVTLRNADALRLANADFSVAREG